MAECHVVHSEKPNAFLIISGAILRFGLQNEQNSTGFIRLFDMAECHVRFIYKPNAFLMIWEAILRFWLGNIQFEQGFIRVCATRFCILKISKFDRFYKVLRRFEIVLR